MRKYLVLLYNFELETAFAYWNLISWFLYMAGESFVQWQISRKYNWAFKRYFVDVLVSEGSIVLGHFTFFVVMLLGFNIQSQNVTMSTVAQLAVYIPIIGLT